MKFSPLKLEGAFIIEPEIFSDERGWFFRFYSENDFRQIGIQKPWVQLNHSYTRSKSTIRGLHFQHPPFSEIKLVKCISGKIFDVIIDLRAASSTRFQWTGVELSAENKRMMYIPEGFAHGFQTLSDNCELIYHHSANYTKDAEGGVRWNDPMIGIHWPMPPANVSERDQLHPLLNQSYSGINL